MMREAWIHVSCPRCGSDSRRALAPRGGQPEGVGLSCPACGFLFPGSSLPDPLQPLTRCAACGCRELYVQKDFNRQLGLAIVAVSGAAAFVIMVIWGHLWGLAVLGAVTLLDALAYRRLGEVSVCYLCQTVHGGLPIHADQVGFYLGNEERFKALRQTWLAEVLASQPLPAAPPPRSALTRPMAAEERA